VKESWLEIEVGGVTSRADLRSGLTRLGGEGCDVVIPGAPEGELHIWSDPAKLIHISGGISPLVGGKPVVEADLSSGETILWQGVRIVFRGARPVVEEIVIEPSAPAPTPAPTRPLAAIAAIDPDERAWTRVRAGLSIDLGLVRGKVVSRWQEAVLRNEFDADVCAREVLDEGALPLDDPRLVERSGRLLRDFLMASLQRGVQGAGRKIRSQARSGTAYLMANAIAITVYSAIVLAVMLLMRLKWNTSFDAFFDFILGRGES
jgi:hypothetical protein